VRSVDIKPVDQWYQVSDDVENVIADLKDHAACQAACRGVNDVYNLAADMGGMGFIENNKALCMLSVLINTHLLQAAEAAKVDRFFYASSACVYNADKQVNFGLAWRLNLLRNDPTADFNVDGIVDGADFLAWQGGSGILLGATLADGDADGDGDVDADDLAVLETTFGWTGVLSTVAVPEPGSLVLLMLMAVALWTLRRRGHAYPQLA